MTITAALVKELRDQTGVGMMECKKALTETNGDIELAIEWLRKNGLAKAAKKADRTAAEGVIAIKVSADNREATMVEINSETDFVARDTNFAQFAQTVVDTALATKAKDINTLVTPALEEARQQLIVKIGEKIDVRRVAFIQAQDFLGSYVHGGRIGVVVSLKGGSVELAKDIAMHIAATRPQVVNPEDVSAELIEKEKEIFKAQAAESGKPADIIEKMISGRINKFLDEVSLKGQPFVKNPDIKVSALLKEHKADVVSFVCFEVGEGIEKKEVNFRDEVMAQVKASS